MRIIQNASLMLFLVISGVSFGQNKTEEKKLIVFDPLFWKEQLNLKPVQFRKIAEINIEFYQTLASVRHERSNDPTAMKLKMNQSLEYRSEQIWNTFYPNQRRKWQKIMTENLSRNKI